MNVCWAVTPTLGGRTQYTENSLSFVHLPNQSFQYLCQWCTSPPCRWAWYCHRCSPYCSGCRRCWPSRWASRQRLVVWSSKMLELASFGRTSSNSSTSRSLFEWEKCERLTHLHCSWCPMQTPGAGRPRSASRATQFQLAFLRPLHCLLFSASMETAMSAEQVSPLLTRQHSCLMLSGLSTFAAQVWMRKYSGRLGSHQFHLSFSFCLYPNSSLVLKKCVFLL